MQDRQNTGARPSLALSAAIFIAATVLMAYLRLVVYRNQFITLTYGLPLLLCLWHRDRKLLWALAATFTAMAALKAFWLLPDPQPGDFAEGIQWAMQVINILATAGIVHAMTRLTERLQAKSARLAQANEELQAQGEELAQQNEELQQQSEELNQQNEELQQAAEELEQQGEELQAQSEELQAANQELNEREAMLQTILASLRGARDERQMLSQVCRALVQLAGEAAESAAVVEQKDDQLVVRVHAGTGELRLDRWPMANSFAALVIAQDRTAFVENLATRPDLVIPEPAGRKFQSVLATPLRVHGRSLGAVELYSLQPRQWTQRQFRIIEWAAAQCAFALEAIRLQQQLADSEGRFRELFASMQECFFVVEVITDPAGCPADWRYLEVNPQVERFMTLSRDQLVGRTYREVVPHPDPTWIAVLGEVAQTRRPTVRELFSPTRKRWLQVNAYSPRPNQAAILFSDITERKQAQAALQESEERLRLAALAANIGVWSWKPGTSQVIVGANWRSLFGVEPAAVVTFETWQAALHPEDRERAVRELNAASAERREFNSEYRVVRPDGTVRWMVDRGHASYDDQGRPTGMTGVNVDITEQKEAQQVLARSKEELEQLVAERTARLQELVGELEHFSYTITHDMRAPLRAMQGFAEMMQETCATCQEQEPRTFLRRITTSAARMDALITDALNYSRAVRQELTLAPVDPGALLRGMLDSYPELQPSKAQIEVAGELPLVLANEAGLTQCFSNLLGNAVKFVKPGQKPQIRIWAERCDGWARIWVEDKGVGIPRSMQPRVFDMFSRGHKNYEGTGIGLALVRKVMDRMGGKVGVESEEGSGSRFWLDLKPGDPPSPS